MKGVIRVRVARNHEGWLAEVPGLPIFRTQGHASMPEAAEALRLKIIGNPCVEATEVDEVMLRLDVPFTEER